MTQLPKIIKNYVLFSILFAFATSCGTKYFYKRVDKKMKCIDKLYQKTKNSIEYSEVYYQFRDTIKSWTENKLKLYEFSDPNNYFINDIIYFNKNKNQCLIVLIAPGFMNKNINADASQFIGGEKVNGKWHFYYHKELGVWYMSYVSTKDSLVTSVSRSVIETGYLELLGCGCRINKTFFNSLIINDEFREAHKDFLNRFN